jgi:hypothetical protein
MTEVRTLTEDYETWLGEQIPVVAGELDRKHVEMSAHEYRFLRGTYYLWLVRVGELLPDVLARPQVPIVGDLHVENYGTWRDQSQIRRWGVNDFDELARGSWLLDLLRLATSAVLAPHIALPDKDICAIVLSAWLDGDAREAVDLKEKGAGHLRALVPEFASAQAFYASLANEAPATGAPPAVAASAAQVAEPGWQPTWHEHVAGTGSLGHRRVVGVGPAGDGTMHAREAKQLGPGTAVWAASHVSGLPVPDDRLYPVAMRAVSGPAGAARVDDWQIRDLAPDVVRIELSGLAHRDTERLLRSMAKAVADVHGSEPAALTAARADAASLPDGALHEAVRQMVKSTRADFAAYAS